MKQILMTTALDEQRFFINKAYCRAIYDAGGHPLLTVYLGQDQRQADDLINMCDGLLLTGGGDIHAKFFGEELHPKANTIFTERDEFEIMLCKRAIALNKPVLGICRGIQLMNVAAGGGILQHVENHSHDDRRREEVHKVLVKNDTMLHDIFQTEQIRVNSIHHQAVGRPAPGFTVSASGEDGITEAIEMCGKTFVIGVQWHPEALIDNSPVQKKLFLRFVEAC